MSKLKIKEGTTSKLVRVFIQDSSSTTGAGLTGLVYNSSGLSAYYLPEGDATAVAITLATMTAGTWATGGFKEVDATNMPGVYEIGLPDAVIDATSEGSTLVMLKGATNMAPVLLEIELDKIDYRDSVRAGLTALPYAAADAAGGLVISDAGGLDIDAMDARISALNDPTAAAIADAVLDESLAGHTTAGSLGKAIKQIKEGVVSAESTVNDASATTTSFVTALTSAVDDFYNDKILVFIDGALSGQARIISDYNGTTKAVTFDEATTSAPANGSGFIILSIHSHPLTQIKQQVRAEIDSNSTQLAAIVADTNELQGDWANGGRLDLILDSVLALLDDARGEPGQGTPPVNPDAMTKLDYLYKAWRNKKTQTATTFSLFDDAGTTVDHKATVSDNGTTATIGEVATGP